MIRQTIVITYGIGQDRVGEALTQPNIDYQRHMKAASRATQASALIDAGVKS